MRDRAGSGRFKMELVRGLFAEILRFRAELLAGPSPVSPVHRPPSLVARRLPSTRPFNLQIALVRRNP